jgi:hypothetical protein
MLSGFMQLPLYSLQRLKSSGFEPSNMVLDREKLTMEQNFRRRGTLAGTNHSSIAHDSIMWADLQEVSNYSDGGRKSCTV